jgi:hypothetical protein
MSAEIPILIETEKTIHDNSQIKSNLKLNSNKRKNSSTSSQSNKKQKMSSQINFQQFEELNSKYEAIIIKLQEENKNSLKMIRNLREEKQELYDDLKKIIKNLKEENKKIKEEKEEANQKFEELSALIFFVADFFGKSFENAKNIFYNYYYSNNNNEDIYIDHKTPLPLIIGDGEQNLIDLEENENDEWDNESLSSDYFGQGYEEYYD